MRVNDVLRLKRLPLFSKAVVAHEKRFHLHAMVSSAGHAREMDPEYSWDGLQRGSTSFAVIQLTVDGMGRLEAPEGTHDLTQGTLMVVSIPSPHRYYLPGDSRKWEFVFIVVHGAELLRVISGIQRRMGNVMTVARASRIPEMFHAILRTIHTSNPLTSFEISAQAYALGMSILAESDSPPATKDALRIEQLKHHLLSNISQEFPVSRMAEFIGLSRTHFTRVFKEREGVTPQEYHDQIRLNRAIQMLYSETLTVKEIAHACGIPDTNYFCRFFKRYMGMPPGEYRQRRL